MTHEHHQHEHHDHGHENDQGVKGALRYLRWLPQMWRSPINDAVVDLVDPQPGERVVDVGAGMGAGAMRAAATAPTCWPSSRHRSCDGCCASAAS